MVKHETSTWIITRDYAERIADSWAREYVRPAWDGDADAAFSLVAALSNQVRGDMAVLMWQGKVPLAAYRTYLLGAWEHDHEEVIDTAGTRRRLAAMFRYASFPRPEWFRSKVRVYRGVHGVGIAEARQGYSWTTDADAACWFSSRGHEGDDRLVVVADVPAEAVALYTDERGEKECVLTAAPASVQVYADPGEWRLGSERFRSHLDAQAKIAMAQSATAGAGELTTQ